MAGKSTQIYSVQIGEAITAGGDKDDNFLPDPTSAGVSFSGMATTTATVDAFAGDEAFHLEDQGRRTPGENKPAAIGIINGSGSTKYGAAQGEFIRAMYPDEISLSHRLRTANGADPDSVAFGKVLNSSMGLYKPSAATVTCADDGANEGQFIIANGDNTKVILGAPVRVYHKAAGQDTFNHEYAVVTSKSVGGTNTTYTVHPKFEHIPQNGDVIQLCYAFYPVIGDASTDSNLSNDIHAQFDMGGTGSTATVRRLASGCRCSGFSITNDNSGASLSMSLRPMVMLQDDANASTATTSEPAGKLLQHRYGCRVDLAASHAGIASGTAASEARAYLPNFDHSIEVSFETAPDAPETRGVIRGGKHLIHNATCQVSITTENNEDLQRLIAKDEVRTLILGFGPGGHGTTNANGAAFILKNASRADGSANPSAGDQSRIQQVTTLRAVADFNTFAGSPTGSELNLASAPFILAFPKS